MSAPVGDVGLQAVRPASAHVHDEIEITLTGGERALIASDLHLGASPTVASTEAATVLAEAVRSWSGPGAVVLNGDIVELVVGDAESPSAALLAHAVLTDALLEFSGGEGRRVVWVAGNHDARVVWDRDAAEALVAATGASLALRVDLVVETPAGVRRVRVEHGHRLDPANAFIDPRSRADTPLGFHIVNDVVPRLPARGRGELLEGVESLADPGGFLGFLGSRLAYRTLGRRLGWILVPLVLTIVARPVLFGMLAHRGLGAWSHRAVLVVVSGIVEIVLLAVTLGLVARRAWRSVGTLAVEERGGRGHDAVRAEAARLVADGYAGLVTGHTHHPELGPVDGGFYANSGCCCRVIDAAPARFGLPPPYLAHRQLSWIEVEAGADLHVRLLHRQTRMAGSNWLERAVARPIPDDDDATGTGGRPRVVAAFPAGPCWPLPADDGCRLRRVRRLAAVLVGLAGVTDIASAVTPPLRGRLQSLLEVLPVQVPQAATALVLLVGIGLFGVARGMRRGQRRAWVVSTGLLAGSAALHLLKGFDVEEAVLAVVLVAWFVRHRWAFRSRSDDSSLRWSLCTLVAGAVLTVALASAVIVLTGARPRPGLDRAVVAAGGRMVGLTGVPLHEELDEFLSPALAAAGLALAAVAVGLVFRPVARRRATGASHDLARARRVVAAHGSDTLSYFALRDDKQWFFSGQTVVAFGVFGGVCLVSPDPIGPPAERDAAWAEFRRWTDAHGWSVAVLGAGEAWLPTYRAAGFRDLYLGDEAVVDCRGFHLDGGTRKGLRQAVNRIAKKGYTVGIYDPSMIGPELLAGLRGVMSDSRRGDVERGFSMTLGRAFDRDDKGLLLVVAFAPDGAPAAFCQYVPSPAINGYSLDLMRRSQASHPNGLTDFVVVETIRHLQERGMTGLALNFATMRAVLDGEAGTGSAVRAERWLLRNLSESFQIESLWQYTEKFGPSWRPRYLAFDAAEHLPATAVAVAKAESFWELPVVGRFLVPRSEVG